MEHADLKNVKLELELECGVDANLLNDVDWFVLSGGTPRREKTQRTPKFTTSKFMKLCSWIGLKVGNKAYFTHVNTV